MRRSWLTHRHIGAIGEQQQRPFNGLWSGTTLVGRYPKKTFTHSHPSGSSCFLYHLSPFATVHGILFIQLMCFTVLAIGEQDVGNLLAVLSLNYCYCYYYTRLTASFQIRIWMRQEMLGVLGWQWYQLDHMQTICTSLHTDNHNNTSSLNFYRPDALSDAQPTVSKHWRQYILKIWRNLSMFISGCEKAWFISFVCSLLSRPIFIRVVFCCGTTLGAALCRASY